MFCSRCGIMMCCTGSHVSVCILCQWWKARRPCSRIFCRCSAAANLQQLTVAYAPELRPVTSIWRKPMSSRSYSDSCCVIPCLDLVSACRVALSGRQLEDSFLLQRSKWWVSRLQISSSPPPPSPPSPPSPPQPPPPSPSHHHHYHHQQQDIPRSQRPCIRLLRTAASSLLCWRSPPSSNRRRCGQWRRCAGRFENIPVSPQHSNPHQQLVSLRECLKCRGSNAGCRAGSADDAGGSASLTERLVSGVMSSQVPRTAAH